jgi:hypothetical protein
MSLAKTKISPVDGSVWRHSCVATSLSNWLITLIYSVTTLYVAGQIASHYGRGSEGSGWVNVSGSRLKKPGFKCGRLPEMDMSRQIRISGLTKAPSTEFMSSNYVVPPRRAPCPWRSAACSSIGSCLQLSCRWLSVFGMIG